MSRFLFVTPLLLVFVLQASGEDAVKTQAKPANMDRLIKQLGSESFTQREAASRELDALGESALDALRKAATSRDAEVRRRASELVRAIETRSAARGYAQAMAVIQKRRGRYERDQNSPDKPVVYVNLSRKHVTDDEVRHLKWLSKLRYLDLSDTDVTDACLDSLRELRHLQVLDLAGTQVTEAGRTRLQKILPKLKIKRWYIEDSYDGLGK